jgi:hypothetical protein
MDEVSGRRLVQLTQLLATAEDAARYQLQKALPPDTEKAMFPRELQRCAWFNIAFFYYFGEERLNTLVLTFLH